LLVAAWLGAGGGECLLSQSWLKKTWPAVVEAAFRALTVVAGTAGQ
jgi:hypothetical protein